MRIILEELQVLGAMPVVIIMFMKGTHGIVDEKKKTWDIYTLFLYLTVYTRVNFIQYPYNRHPIAHLSVLRVKSNLPSAIFIPMPYVISANLSRVLTALDCIWDIFTFFQTLQL